jgi:hypothetical protein
MLFFAGIPLGILAVALAVIFGKGDFDLHSIAANAQTSVNGVLKQAQDEASDAKKTAGEAFSKSQQVDAEIKSTERSVSKLRSDVEARSADVQKLGSQLDTSRRQLDALVAKANSQEAQFAKMTRQVQAIQTAKGVADVQAVYPIYGEHVAQGPRGVYIDPKAKPAGAIYLDLNLSLTQTPNVSDAKVGEAIAALTNNKFTVSIGPVYMIARTASGSAQNVGMPFDSGSCVGWAKSQPPCILYFTRSMRDSATKTRDIVKVAQQVPDDHIIYIDPSSLNAQQRELLNLSATDIVVVLGQ